MMNLFAYPQLAFISAITWLKSRFDVADETGATAVEYGMMVALIAAVIVATVALLGGEIKTAFKTVCNAIQSGTCP